MWLDLILKCHSEFPHRPVKLEYYDDEEEEYEQIGIF